MTPPIGYRTPEVCQLAGVSYRQLDYWARTGQLVPSIREAEGSGSSRLYSSYDVAQAKVLGRLSALGLRANRATDTVPEGPRELLDFLILELHALRSELEDDREAVPA